MIGRAMPTLTGEGSNSRAFITLVAEQWKGRRSVLWQRLGRGAAVKVYVNPHEKLCIPTER